ncbi:hypothetical protein EI94DRAFT_1698080 [Lactarius quietus]|nr:hypothetical protein EI94DRAFT_1698080 [Lactarius quietus]
MCVGKPSLTLNRELLTILHAVVVTFYWVMVKLVVNPVEGLLRINGWQAELRLTASLTFSTIEHSKVFNHAIPMRIRFAQEVPAHIVVAQITEMDASECLEEWEEGTDFCEWRKEQGQANTSLLSGGGDAELYSDEVEKERQAAELSGDGDEDEKERLALHAVPVVQRMDQSMGTQQQALKGLPWLGGPHNGGTSLPGAFSPAMVLGRWGGGGQCGRGRRRGLLPWWDRPFPHISLVFVIFLHSRCHLLASLGHSDSLMLRLTYTWAYASDQDVCFTSDGLPTNTPIQQVSTHQH